jgi:hypothetical protein
MPQLATTSAANREVVHNDAQTVQTNTTSPASVLITEQEVLFGTRAASVVFPQKASTHRGWIEALRVAVGSLHLPPPRQHYPRDPSYLERARMGREMDRL